MTLERVLIPHMSDHAYLVQAAMRHFGLPGEAMPPPDDESTNIGIGLSLGKECNPCVYVVGDVIRRLRQPDCDPKATAVFYSTAEGPCRYGQYHVLLRHILDEQGFPETEILCPTASNAYNGFGPLPTAFRMLMWRGIVALDLLQALLHRHRPYENNPGEADGIYRAGLDNICAAVQQGGRPLVQTMRQIGKEFRRLALDRSTPRPQIGLVGELYVRHNSVSNRNLIHRVEALGGEVILATVMEYLYYVNWWCSYKQRRHGNWREVAKTRLSDLYQRFLEFQLARPIADLLVHRFESRAARLMQHTAKYMDPEISTEAVISVGKAVELAHHGASGILNVLPFTCMPGMITTGLAPRIRRDLDGIPWLDLSYDMQQGTNVQTRLEAFMYQAHHFQRRQQALAQASLAAPI